MTRTVLLQHVKKINIKLKFMSAKGRNKQKLNIIGQFALV